MSCRTWHIVLLSIVAVTASALAQQALIPFAADVPPTFSFSESYTESGAWSTDEDDFVDTTSYTADFAAKASMTGINVSTFDDNTLALKVTIGTLDLDLPFTEGTRSVAASGAKLIRWYLEGYDPNTYDDLPRAGTVELRYDAAKVTVTYSLSDDWEEYSIAAPEQAGEAASLDFTLPVTLTVGPYGFTGRVTYVAGSVELYDFTATHGSESYEFTELSKVRLTGEIDSGNPTVQITVPVAGAIVMTPSIAVLGTAVDDHNLQSLLLQVNGGEFKAAALAEDGTWSLGEVSLDAGENTLVARAIDADGNMSDSSPRMVHYAVMSALSVSGDGLGSGTISASFFEPIRYNPGEPLQVRASTHEVGESLILEANAAEGSVFEKWISNHALTAEQAASPRLTVQMQPDMQLLARFVRNPFIPVRGRYTGLIQSRDPFDRGVLKGKLGATGAFSLNLRIGGLTIPLRGQFSTEGTFDSVVIVDSVAYGISLQLNVTGIGQRQITGSVTGGGIDATLTADLSTFSKGLSPLPSELVGTYNVLLPPTLTNTDPNFPIGIGYGRLSLTQGGDSTFTGRLADGTALSTSGVVAGEPNQHERYSSIFADLKRQGGTLSGRLTIDLTHPDHDVSGTVDWFKPARINARGQLRPGFSGQVDLAGGKYDKETPDQVAFLNGGQLTVLAPASPALPAWSGRGTCAVNSAGSVTVLPSAGSTLALSMLTIDGKTGLIGGSLVEGSKPRMLFGIFVPHKLGFAGGFLLRGGRSASVTILPPP